MTNEVAVLTHPPLLLPFTRSALTQSAGSITPPFFQHNTPRNAACWRPLSSHAPPLCPFGSSHRAGSGNHCWGTQRCCLGLEHGFLALAGRDSPLSLVPPSVPQDAQTRGPCAAAPVHIASLLGARVRVLPANKRPCCPPASRHGHVLRATRPQRESLAPSVLRIAIRTHPPRTNTEAIPAGGSSGLFAPLGYH